MSTTQNSREVAYRLFATEFEDATLSYSAGDDERAPKYVVTPTGGRINRLFTVGALTAVESVTDNLRRGRIADPTGVFVTYAGQYQPAAANFLEQATPPTFVALTGKARTYQPEESDQVLTSARPEGLTPVDADTRDRWAVGAAQATLRRIAIMNSARSLSVRGDALRNELVSRGVDEAYAEGTALAIEHYGTTEFYLESLRKAAIQVLELVAGNRDTVETPDPNPSETGAASLGALPSIAIDTTLQLQLQLLTTTSTVADTTDNDLTARRSDAESAPIDTDTNTDTTVTAESSSSQAQTQTQDQDQEVNVDTDIVQPAADGDSSVESSTEPDQYQTPDPIGTETDAENGVTTTKRQTETETETESESEAANAIADDDSLADFPGGSTGGDEPTETVDDITQNADSTETQLDREIQREVDESTISTAADNTSTSTSASNSDIVSGDEGSDAEPDDPDDSSTVGSATTEGDITADPTEMYEFDDDERAEIENEFGTEFSTGNEVDAPGSADIDVPTAPDADPSDNQPSAEVTSDASNTDSADVDPHETPAQPDIDTDIDTDTQTEADADTDVPLDDISEEDTITSDDLGDFETETNFASASPDDNSPEIETESESETETSEESTQVTDSDDTQDVDLEQAAVSVMSELDDGDGATREAVIDAVVDMHDVSPDAVETAIQSALMSGRCYESGDDALKAI
jgi:Uncharacterized protein conserved in archaea